MSKVDFFSRDKILICAEEEKKKTKKGDGINSILGLIQETRNFMEKVEAAAEAQDIAENREAIEALNTTLRENSKKLLDIVAGGLTSEVNTIRRKEEPVGQMESAESMEKPIKVEKNEEVQAPKAPGIPTSFFLGK